MKTNTLIDTRPIISSTDDSAFFSWHIFYGSIDTLVVNELLTYMERWPSVRCALLCHIGLACICRDPQSYTSTIQVKYSIVVYGVNRL